MIADARQVDEMLDQFVDSSFYKKYYAE